MWHLGTCVSGGLGDVGLTVGLHDLKCSFWPKWFSQGKRAAVTHWSEKLGVPEPPWSPANKNTHRRDGHPKKQPLRNPILTHSWMTPWKQTTQLQRHQHFQLKHWSFGELKAVFADRKLLFLLSTCEVKMSSYVPLQPLHGCLEGTSGFYFM